MLKMSADGSSVRQKRTQSRPLAGAVESSDEHVQNLMRTFAVVKGSPKRATTARKAESRHFSQTTDNEGEVGRFGSRQFLELVKYGSMNEDSLKRANKYFEDFKKTIDTQGKNLESEINRYKAQSSSRDIEFSDYFATAYSPILHDNTTTQKLEEHLNTDTTRSCNILHQRSTEVLTSAAALTEQLQKSCRKLETQQTSCTVDADWHENMHKMKCILDCGKQIGEQKVEKIFTGIGNPMLDAQTAEISQLLYDKQRRLASELTWDQVVRKQDKAVMRLVKTLPWE